MDRVVLHMLYEIKIVNINELTYRYILFRRWSPSLEFVEVKTYASPKVWGVFGEEYFGAFSI